MSLGVGGSTFQNVRRSSSRFFHCARHVFLEYQVSARGKELGVMWVRANEYYDSEFRRIGQPEITTAYLCNDQSCVWHSLLQYIVPEHPTQRLSLSLNSDSVRRHIAQRSAKINSDDGVEG